MKTKRTALAILGFLSVAFFGQSAAAFCRATTADHPLEELGPDGCPLGTPLYWKSQCVGIRLDEAASQYVSLDDARRLLGEAFAKWLAAGGQCLPSIDVIQLAPVASPKLWYDAGAPTENDVVFRDHDWPYAGSDSTFELVTTIFKKATGELLDSDAEFNGARLAQVLQAQDAGTTGPESSPGLRRIFMHAAGHFLGFAHSPDPSSVMYANYSAFDTSEPALTDDDAAGICAAYPPDGTRPTLDAKGNPISIRSTPCALGAATPASACSSSSLHIDHGCSLAAPRSASHDRAAAFVIAGVVISAARRRRERAVSAMA